MGRVYIYGDESGDFRFDQDPSASTYFLVATVTTRTNAVAHALLDLQQDLLHEGFPVGAGFHAYNDDHPVRTRVFETLARHDFRIDATILRKDRAHEHIRGDNLRLWKLTWYFHLNFLVPRAQRGSDSLLVSAAALSTKMSRKDARAAIEDIVAQVRVGPAVAALPPASSSYGLQAADYCAWAIQRKWQSEKDDYYRLIKSKIKSEFAMFGK
ncbi:MAG: DUF3800 domain-containing protein [Chloroflexi bacterium]|nr:DUF3800 domain-containing protein [Chloroflexota bacterium]